MSVEVGVAIVNEEVRQETRWEVHLLAREWGGGRRRRGGGGVERRGSGGSRHCRELICEEEAAE